MWGRNYSYAGDKISLDVNDCFNEMEVCFRYKDISPPKIKSKLPEGVKCKLRKNYAEIVFDKDEIDSHNSSNIMLELAYILEELTGESIPDLQHKKIEKKYFSK